MSQQFLIAAVLLLPLQTLSLFVMGSRYDMSAFVLLAFAGAVVLRRGIRARSAIALLAFILLHVCLLAWFGTAPAYRLFSGVVWLGGLLFLLLEGDRMEYRQDLICKLLIGVLAASALYIFPQYFLLALERPSAWFHEPSFAGLCLYAAAAGLLMALILVRSAPRIQLLLVALFVLFFSAALLTFSMHIVTFIITVVAAVLFVYVPRMLTLRIARFGFRTFLLVVVFGALLVYVGNQMLQMEHFVRRIDLANPTNYSLLSWLRGLDQMVAAMRTSFVFGMGLGSTGYFEFQSLYSDILTSLGKPELNLTDAYSLAFRLVIEIGLPLLLLFLLYLAARLRAFAAYVREADGTPAPMRVAVVFNFVFALGVIAGCLLKEPLYPQSFLYVAVMLVASIPLRSEAVARQRAGLRSGATGDGLNLQPTLGPAGT
jgi:hypothetical protein